MTCTTGTNWVKLHKEKRPVFSRFQIEEQIDQIYEKRVPLPSGGSLIIEPTEALVSIDVNSGKSSGERGIEDTAFKTNMEAAEEVARQLRLRDLGGLIVIDFIDMRDRKHNHEVEKTLKQALKMDKARVNLGRISDFGILEMSRQRIAKTLNDAIHLACPHCEGRGKVKSVEAMALSFLRKIHGAAAKGTVAEVHGGLPLEVAYYLLNRKKRELVQIENDYDIEVHVKGKTSLLMNQLELDIIKREKVRPEDLPKSEAEYGEPTATPAPETAIVATTENETASEQPVAEGAKKRKRRRKKKKPAGELATAVEQQQELSTEEPLTELPVPPQTETIETPETPSETVEPGTVPKKRRRRRSRKPAKATDESTPAAVEADEEAAPGPESVESEPSEHVTVDTIPLEPAPSAITPDEPASSESDAYEAPAEPALEPPKAAKPKRTRSPRSLKKTVPDPDEPAMETAAVEAETATAELASVTPKPRRRPVKTKVPPPVITTEEAGTAQPKPAPKKPRSKKDVAKQ